ncbi:MAG: MBL fold metallo-hydrolase [Ignavibacteria bacterium]
MIKRVTNDLYSSNTYFICNEINNNCIIIDPGLNEIIIEKRLIDLDLRPIAIIATHGHFDHIGGVSYFKEKYSIPFYLHQNDYKLMKSSNFFLKLSKINKVIKIGEPDCLINENRFRLELSEFELEIINFQGHTDGSCVIKYKDNLFTGDTVFKKGLYINRLPGENTQKLKESITRIFEEYKPSDMCYPGHGSEASIEYIKSNNKELINFLAN